MLRISTALVNAMGAHKSLKEATIDSVLRIYSGSQPSTADSAVTGTLLAELTLAGGAFTGTASTRQVDKYVVSTHTEGQTFIVTVDGTAYTYTAGAGETDTTVATGLAALLDASDVVSAVSNAETVITRARFGGNAYTATTSGTGTVTKTNLVANARTNGIQLGTVSDGVISKETGVWQDDGIVDGTAGWFRICRYADAGGSSTSEKRIDGNVSTTSGELILKSTAIYAGVPVVVNTGSFTIPKVRT